MEAMLASPPPLATMEVAAVVVETVALPGARGAGVRRVAAVPLEHLATAATAATAVSEAQTLIPMPGR